MYPENEKLGTVMEKWCELHDFLAWLNEQGLRLAEGTVRDFYPTSRSEDSIVNSYFGIDGVKLEHERRAILAELRAKQGVA